MIKSENETKNSAYIYIQTILIICLLIIIGGLIWFIVAMINNKPQQVGFAVCVMLFGWGIENTNMGFYRMVREEKKNVK